MQPKQRNKVKVLLTGGHAGSTAFAVIEQIKKHKDWEVFYIGSRSSLEGEKIRTLSEINLEGLDVERHFLYTGRLQRKFSVWTLPSLVRIPIGFIHALYLLLGIRPDVVLSFGGYAAYPVVLMSWLIKKPVIIHEQTAAAGRANIHSARFAKRIALARKTSLKYFNKKKCIVTGNPVSSGIGKVSHKTRISNPPVLFFTGGASGSVTINNLIYEILNELLLDYVVIHQTGELQYKYFTKRKDELNNFMKRRYEVYGVVHSAEWPKLLAKSDILISRAGANIVSEIIATRKPSLLIPIPFSYLDEQKKNALYAQRKRTAKVLDQNSITSQMLLREINQIRESWDRVVRQAGKVVSPDIGSAKRLVDVIQNVLDEEKKG